MIGENERPNATASLRVFEGERLVFESKGRWLHPLFELERRLDGSGMEPLRLRIEDKIIGRAAAFLIVRLGFRRAHGARLSRLGERVFRAFGVEYSYDELVDRIACATETLLADVDDIDKAYALVKERAAAGASRTSLP